MRLKLTFTCLAAGVAVALAQPPDFGGGFGGPGGPGGRGGRGGPMMESPKLLEKFDKDGDGILNSAERKAARESIASEPNGGVRRGPFGGQGPAENVPPGPKLTPDGVKKYKDE